MNKKELPTAHQLATIQVRKFQSLSPLNHTIPIPIVGDLSPNQPINTISTARLEQ